MRTLLLRALLLAALCLPGGGCVFHSHTVGLGPTGAETRVERQYYTFFGFFDVNDVDSARMAGDLTSYAVETRFGAMDLLLSPFLAVLFFSTSRTVIVRT